MIRSHWHWPYAGCALLTLGCVIIVELVTLRGGHDQSTKNILLVCRAVRRKLSGLVLRQRLAWMEPDMTTWISVNEQEVQQKTL
jgi:hypothetical protein